MPGIGIRVNVWLNTTGEYDGVSSVFNVDNSEHHIGDADFPLVKPGFLLSVPVRIIPLSISYSSLLQAEALPVIVL